MRSSLAPLVWIAAAAVGHAACGFPEFEYLDDEATTVGNGGQGGAGSGGAPPCSLGMSGVCGAGQKCTIVDAMTGAVGCAEAGPRGAFSRCGDDRECVDGTYCDPVLEVCKPVCESANDCGMGAQCYDAERSPGTPIPGLKLCTANCHPTMGAPCDGANGMVTCFHDADRSNFDCAASLGIGVDQACSSPTDCVMGAFCAGQPNPTCLPWCQPVMQTCDIIFLCFGLSPAAVKDGQEWGVCT